MAIALATVALAAGCSSSDGDGDRGAGVATTATTARPGERDDEATTSSTPARPFRQYLLFTSDDVHGLPAEGPAWDALVAAAQQELVPALGDQDVTSAPAVAAGLVYARTGEEAYRLRVEEALAQLPGTEEEGRTLSLGRQLAGWVIAADLVGYRDPAFLRWLDEVRTSEIGGHGRWRTLTATHETTATNWGTLAGASRIAASRYLGDEEDVARAADVLRGWLGEAGEGAWEALPQSSEREVGFLPSDDFDRSWTCQYPAWTPVNGPCGDRGGALVEDISRGDAYPNATEVGLRYSWEALQGAVLQALLLAAGGERGVWAWGDEALRRSADFLRREGGFDGDEFDQLHHWVPWAVDAVYGTSYATVPAGGGRSFGFTDWLAPVMSELATTSSS